jgi:hypothetical protein
VSEDRLSGKKTATELDLSRHIYSNSNENGFNQMVLLCNLTLSFFVVEKYILKEY